MILCQKLALFLAKMQKKSIKAQRCPRDFTFSGGQIPIWVSFNVRLCTQNDKLINFALNLSSHCIFNCAFRIVHPCNIGNHVLIWSTLVQLFYLKTLKTQDKSLS